MNGEMYNACSIVIAAKNALKGSKSISCPQVEYEKVINFEFLPQKKLFIAHDCKALSVEEWFEELKIRKIKDIKLLTNTEVKDRSILGFANMKQVSIICFYEKDLVTYFVPRWEFDDTVNGWFIYYKEYEIKDNSLEKLEFINPAQSFSDILKEIAVFAETIGFENFSNIFSKALNLLDGEGIDGCKIKPDLPKENLNLFLAASEADVFGAMGSWNDSPPYIAHEKGLDKQYEELSSRLYCQMVKAILYAVNEW